jgi:hypothetical protein
MVAWELFGEEGWLTIGLHRSPDLCTNLPLTLDHGTQMQGHLIHLCPRSSTHADPSPDTLTVGMISPSCVAG